MDMHKIKRALPIETGSGRRSTLRARSDVAEVVVDCVLRRRQYLQIAERCAVDIETVNRFRRKFITEEVKRLVMLEDQKQRAQDSDDAVNDAQDSIQKGLREIIDEQKSLFNEIRTKVGEQGRDIEDVVPALAVLLRDRGQSFDRLLKSYTALRDKTTIVLSINENPEWSKLQAVLYAVFEAHPDAFRMFRELVSEKRLKLDEE